MKKILTIGAYERDNFGDLLFYFTVKEFFKQHHVVPASIIYSDMSDLMGEIVYPYHVLLNDFKWDMVIVVGGEIGGVDMRAALNMSLSDYECEVLEMAGNELQKPCHDFLTGSDVHRPAYLPDLTVYKKNQETPLIVNSVGLNSIQLLNNQELKEKFIDILKKTQYLSVRDHNSFDYLNSINISSVLSPDIVHTIRRLMDDRVDKQVLERATVDDYILFQCNQSFIVENSVDFLVSSLIKLIEKYNKKIYFFAAGVARQHDSVHLYEQIASALNKQVSNPCVSVIYERNAFSLAKYIKYASLWIGTSLHGRIIAISYSIPRVSLTNKKVAEYAKYWDKDLPYNIGLNDLLDASDVALNFEIEKLDAIASFLELEAYQNLSNNIGS